jgi:hypothetical protein
MRLFVFMLLVGLVVSGFNAGLQQIAPAGWWGGIIPAGPWITRQPNAISPTAAIARSRGS